MDFQKLTAFLDTLPGLGIPGGECIVQAGYETVYRHRVGYADREKQIPLAGKERFFLYSCSKLITCTAAMQLFEKGAFLLTDPLYEYLPEYRHMTVRTARGNGEERLRPAGNPITVGDLFAMTAGFDYDLTAPEIAAVQEKTEGRAPTREVVRALAARPLCYEPGERWQYSLGHDVLGGLIEVISGRPFGQYLQNEIFDPLEMSGSGFPTRPGIMEGMMAQYRRNEETGEAVRIPLENEYIFGTEYESGGAGLISCVDDYARFAAALANGGTGANGARILGRHTIDLMRENRLSQRQRMDFDWVRFRGYGYGLGVRTMVDRAEGGAPSPKGEFGWAGAGGAYVLIDPANSLSMFYAQHMRKNLEEYVHPRLRNILYACL